MPHKTCKAAATKMPMFAIATLKFPEKLVTHPEIIKESPKTMMEQLIMRTIAEPSFRKLFAEIYAIEIVAIDQKTKFNAKATFGGLK